jgi:CheY-like chemotaxis protein
MSRVLLVDDDVRVRNALYELLERGGHQVLAAGNGPDGLAVFRESTPPIELLVTDYNMPNMSGLELARACSRHSSQLGVLYVSACRPDDELQVDLKAPRRAFLAKPFRGEELLRKAREVLYSLPLRGI